MVSPHAGAVLLAHLLAPLVPLGLVDARATLVQPASAQGKRGLDELFEQTRSLLAFSSERPEEVFGRQLAFNLYPAPRPDLGPRVASVLSGDVTVSAQLLQAGVFHGVSASVEVDFGFELSEAEIAEAYETGSFLAAVDDAEPSPVDAANREVGLVGSIQRGPGESRFWLWAVLDNLTLGAAENAVRLAEPLLR